MSSIIESIAGMDVPANMIALIVLFGCTASVIGAVAKQIRDYACHRQEIEFKRELVDRGMAADDIERIITARGDKNAAASQKSSAKHRRPVGSA